MGGRAHTMSKESDSSCGASQEEQVRALYTDLALHPGKRFGWGTGKTNAHALGYDVTWLEQLPPEVWESSAAVGNPFAIGPIHSGETVVDLGCGAGADVCVAALLVGSVGRVVGIDLTTAMVEKARANAARAGFRNVTIHEADMAALPLPNAFADVVISNGAINLTPHKACAAREALRVLKPGGRLYVADMVRDLSRSRSEQHASRASWANCIAGTLAPDCFVRMLEEAGFVDVTFVGTTGYRTAPQTIGATFRAHTPS